MTNDLRFTAMPNKKVVDDYRVYSQIYDIENQLLTDDQFEIIDGNILPDLEQQSLTTSLLDIVAEKMSQFWGITKECSILQFRDLLCTIGWVFGRMQKISDWNDVYSIMDYITRIHFKKPAMNFILDSFLGTDCNMEAQSMDWSVLKDLVSNYNTIKTHPAVVKFIKVVTLAFSGGVFSTLGIDFEMAELWNSITECMSKILGHTDFISAVIDLFYFVGERISAFCATGSWKSLLHTPTNYTNWADSAFDLLDKSVALANPEAIGLDYHKYMKDLSRLIEEGEEIKRYVRAADEKDAVSRVLSRLRVLNNDLIIKNSCGQFRMAPFAMLISSGSGVGKSSFMDTLLTHYAKLFNKPLDEDSIYVRTATEEHWNNFKTCMWACILDDVAMVNPNKGTKDPSSEDIVHAINNFSFSPPQAAIEDKGRTPFKCELVLASTNTEDLKAHNWFNNPQAIRRRLPYVINLLPKEQYRIAGTNMLDTSKVEPTEAGCYPNLWDISVKKVMVDKDEKVVTNVIFTTSNIYEFILKYNEWIDEHRRGQVAFMVSKQTSRDVVLCGLHKIPSKVCPCEPSLEKQCSIFDYDDDDLESDYPDYEDDDNEDDCYLENSPSIYSVTKIRGEVVICDIHRLPSKICGCILHSQSGEVDTAVSVQATPLNFKTIALAGVTAFATYKAAEFTSSCTREALNSDIRLQWQPTALFRESGRIMVSRFWDYCDAQFDKVLEFTREEIKKKLQRAAINMIKIPAPQLAKIMMALGFFSSLGISWLLLKKEFPEFSDLETQVSIHEVGTTPPQKKEKENVWRKDDYCPSEFLGRLSQSWSSLELSKAASLIARNVVWCQTTHAQTKHTTFRATCVFGHLYVVPHHVIPMDDYFMLHVISDNNAEGCNGNINFKVAQACIYRRPDLELAFFEIRHMPARRNLLELFPKQGFQCDAPGRMIVRSANGSLEYVDTRRSATVPNQFLDQFNIVTNVVASVMQRDTVNGECGSPTIVRLPNACILAGLHVLGGQRLAAIAVPVTQEVIVDAVQFFDTTIIEVQKPQVDDTFSADISQRCTARFIDEGTLEVFGSFGGFKKQPKSTATDTLFTQALIARGKERKFAPAPMKGYTALHLGLKSIVQKTMTFKEDVLKECTRSFANSIIGYLPNDSKEELKSTLTLKVALNGMPGTKFIDSMNFGTSAGYPYNKSKRFFIERLPADDIWQHPIIVNQEIEEAIADCWFNMCAGISVAPVFMEHIKDEALPLRKVKAGKARLFMGGPFAWSVCVRMALLPFVRVMQLHKYLFECAPGTNATSIEWTRLYQYVTQHGTDRLIAGDFEAFDKLMGSLVILEAFRFIKLILKDAGAEETHLKAVQVIAEDVAFAFVNFNGDLMRFFGSNPSGHPLTVIINCIVNSLYMRYCYHELNPCKEVDTFKKHVALITYGDDNAMSSSVDWFNHTSIAKVLATVGVNYTMADKLAQSVPFISINEVSFLKRTFRWDDELSAYMATLDTESIWKSLMIYVPSKTDSPQKQCVDIVRSAVSEWFFYGKERFEAEVILLKELLIETNLECYVETNTFPTWEELSLRFIECSNDYLSTEPITTQDIIGPLIWRYTFSDRSLVDLTKPLITCDLKIQSSELQDGTILRQQQQNLMFADAGMADTLVVPMVSYRPDCDTSAHLGSFLERPVAISTFSWAEGSTTTNQLQFKPWDLFFNSPPIKRKIQNYARLRAKLHLKFVVNASPFYYGGMRICYCPMDGGFRDTIESTSGEQIKFSQMPGDFLYPQDMTSMELELPFLWPHAWLNLTKKSDFETMGQITYLLYSQLRSANGVSGSNVTITCFAWATDVELAGLTTGLVLQSDEYDDNGIISGPATAVANVAQKLSDTPVIGKLARATEIGARAVGGIASLFGYSNPPVINDVHGFVPKSFHAFSSVETGMPMDKLTLDPKNEITVDKTVTGASGDDELVISHFCARKSFVTGTLWTDAHIPGTQLFHIPVTPRNYSSTGAVSQSILNETPASHVCSMFSQWRGGMIYTLRFIKTRYHTGRVQISWDPQQQPMDADANTTTMTRIVDLQLESEVSFMVPFKAQDPWLKTDNIANNWAITPAGSISVDPVSFNGYLRVTVVNELTGPASAQEIDILIFANTAPDFQVSVPNELPDWSFLTVQSQEEDQLVDVAQVSIPPDTNAITVGETIASLRTMLHRTSFYHREFMGNPFSADGVYYTKGAYTLVNYVPRFPVEYGYSTEGVNYATGIIAPTKNQFQYSPSHPINWITNCFVGYRGSIVHQYNLIANGSVLPDEVSVERDPRTHILDTAPRQAINRFSIGTNTSQASTLSRVPTSTQLNVKRGVIGQRGMAMTNSNTQSAVSVVTPQYSKWKFRPAYVKRRDIVSGISEKESIKVAVTMRAGSSTTTADEGWPILSTYIAGGVDFDPIYFVCVPTLYSFVTTTPDNTY